MSCTVTTLAWMCDDEEAPPPVKSNDESKKQEKEKEDSLLDMVGEHSVLMCIRGMDARSKYPNDSCPYCTVDVLNNCPVLKNDAPLLPHWLLPPETTETMLGRWGGSL